MIITFRSVTVTVELLECDACGGVVPDNIRARAKHRQWHEDQERIAREATRMRPTDRIG